MHTMEGTDVQCTVLGRSIVPVLVAQVLRCGEEDYHVVANEGASPLMPLSRLILLRMLGKGVRHKIT